MAVVNRVEHQAEQEAYDVAVQKLSSVQGGPWLMAVWQVRDGRIELVNWTTWKYPTGDFVESAKLLQRNLEQEVGDDLPREPLPMADFLKPMHEPNGEKTE